MGYQAVLLRQDFGSYLVMYYTVYLLLLEGRNLMRVLYNEHYNPRENQTSHAKIL